MPTNGAFSTGAVVRTSMLRASNISPNPISYASKFFDLGVSVTAAKHYHATQDEKRRYHGQVERQHLDDQGRPDIGTQHDRQARDQI